MRCFRKCYVKIIDLTTTTENISPDKNNIMFYNNSYLIELIQQAPLFSLNLPANSDV